LVQETPAEKKLREKEERDAERLAIRENVADVRACQIMMGKFCPTLRSLEALVDKPTFDFVASVLKDPITDGIQELKDLEDRCLKVIADESGKIEDWDVKSVAAKVSNLKRASAYVVQVLATISRAQG